jgi:hypothetical protein
MGQFCNGQCDEQQTEVVLEYINKKVMESLDPNTAIELKYSKKSEEKHSITKTSFFTQGNQEFLPGNNYE